MGKWKDAWNVLTGKEHVRSNENVTKWMGGNDDIPLVVNGNENYAVTPSMTLKLATVYRCTSIVSGAVGSLPLVLKKRVNGYWETVEEGNLPIILGLRPNPRQTRFDLMRNAIIQILNQGNAYIYPEWSARGELESLTLLSPNTCTYDKDTNTYTVNDFTNNIFGTFSADEMVHLRNISTDGGYLGVSTITYAAKVLRICAKSDDKSEEVYSPGGTRKGFVTGGDDLTRGVGLYPDQQVQNVASRVDKELKSGKSIMNLPSGTEFRSLDLSPADTQLLQSKEFGVLEICRFYGVHPDKVFAGQSTNYKASEMSQVLFMSDTLQQILTQISLEFTVKLFLKSQYGKYKIEFGVEDFYNTDLMTMATFTEKNIASGIWTINEARQKRGYPPIAGGDDLLMSANLLPVGYKEGYSSKKVPPKTE